MRKLNNVKHLVDVAILIKQRAKISLNVHKHQSGSQIYKRFVTSQDTCCPSIFTASSTHLVKFTRLATDHNNQHHCDRTGIQ